MQLNPGQRSGETNFGVQHLVDTYFESGTFLSYDGGIHRGVVGSR